MSSGIALLYGKSRKTCMLIIKEEIIVIIKQLRCKQPFPQICDFGDKLQ